MLFNSLITSSLGILTDCAPGEVATVFSWTLLTSFVFLLFSSTRLFHLVLLIGITASGGLALGGLDQKADKDMILTTIVFGSVSLAVLFYYFTLSRTVTDSIEYREKERLVRLENKYKDRIERMREKGDENLDFVKQERENLKNEYIKLAKEKEKLENKLDKRRKERNYLKKKLDAVVDKNFYDTDDDDDTD